jgi:GNAT superfamily N-acetyltransferase
MTPAITIRTARRDEAAELEALELRASLANAGDRDAILAHPDAIEIPVAQLKAGQVFVAERGATAIGVAAAIPRPDGQFELDALFVEPSLWKGGVGRALIEHCCDYARVRGADTLHVIGNPHAEGFYLACGFIAQGAHQTRFGVGLRMAKALIAASLPG